MIDNIVKRSPRLHLKTTRRQLDPALITPMNKHEAILFQTKNGKANNTSKRLLTAKCPQELLTEASMQPYQSATIDVIPEVSSDMFSVNQSNNNQKSMGNTSGQINLNKTLSLNMDDTLPHFHT